MKDENDENETLEVPLTTPEYHLTDEDVEGMEIEYSTRHPSDWVISGPLGPHGKGPGRTFHSWKAARAWATEKYGTRLMGRIREAAMFGGNRWAFLIRGERGPVAR